MNVNRLNIIVAVAVLSTLAGCSTTYTAGYSNDTPIMSAEDARSMIRIEVSTVEPAPPEQELVAAVD